MPTINENNPLDTDNLGGFHRRFQKEKARPSVTIVRLNPEPPKAKPDSTIKVAVRLSPARYQVCVITTGAIERQIPIDEGLVRIVRDPQASGQPIPSRLFCGSGGNYGLRIISECEAAHGIVLDHGRLITFDSVAGASCELRYIAGRVVPVALYRATLRDRL